MRFRRVTFGINFIPFLLTATILHHLRLFENSNVVRELQKDLYVDDWLTGADSITEVEEMYEQAKAIMLKGNFPLAKWKSSG
jgi:hypothetical protein